MAGDAESPRRQDVSGSGSDSDSAQLTKDSVSLRHPSRVPIKNTVEAPLLEQVKELVQETRTKYKLETRGYGWYDWVAWFIPFFGWIRTYNIRGWLLSDVVAGLSVAAMVIPQGMSYSSGLAGLPNVYGLYGAFVPTIFYGLLGSSKQLAVGPVAVTSTLLGNGLGKIFPNISHVTDPNNPGKAGNASITDYNDPNSAGYFINLQNNYNQAAIQIAFIAGFFYFGIGIFRLGWITNFLSASVISGFMTGASITIALSQVKYITGQSIPRTDTAQSGFEQIFQHLDQFKWREFCMGMAWVYLLVSFQILARRYSKWLGWLRAVGPLAVCIISIALMNIFKWYRPPTDSLPADYTLPAGKTLSPLIKPVGNIPSGLPGETVSWWTPLFDVSKQMVLAVLICLIDVCESISIARALAQKNKYRLEATQELRGLGIANIAGACFNCYTTTGSFSRSAVNNSVGAKTGLANIITGFTIMIVLLCLTVVFENMSSNVQGAIIIVGVLQLFDLAEFFKLLHINVLDAGLWVITFLFTIFFGVEIGIACGVGVSVVIALLKVAFPSISLIGRVPGTDIYRQISLYPEAETVPGILALRIDAPIFFGNALNIRDDIHQKIDHKRLDGEPVVVLVLDLAAVGDIDGTGIRILYNFVDDLHDENIQLILVNPNKHVLVQLKRAKLDQRIGEAYIHINASDAIQHSNAILSKVQPAV